jgi:hypothetical protein
MKPSAFVKSIVLNDLENAALDAIAEVNVKTFHGFFKWSTVMAVCYVESRFKTHAMRHEPSGVTSYGIMQVLDVTAADLAKRYKLPYKEGADLFNLKIGLLFGMRYLADGYNLLNRHWKDDVDYESLFAGYNEGYGAVLKGRSDENYVMIVEPVRERYAIMDQEQLTWNSELTSLTFSQ